MTAPSPFVRSLAILAALTAVAACRSPEGIGSEERPEPVPRFLITGAVVEPVDRRTIDGKLVTLKTDTLTGQVVFEVTTVADRLPDVELRVVPASGAAVHAALKISAASAAIDENPGIILNPTPLAKRWVSIDRPIVHRGVEIPANTNLFTIPAVVIQHDEAGLDVAMSQLSPFAVGAVRFRLNAFQFPTGDYTFDFRWGTEGEQEFRAVVSVYIKLTTP